MNRLPIIVSTYDLSFASANRKSESPRGTCCIQLSRILWASAFLFCASNTQARECFAEISAAPVIKTLREDGSVDMKRGPISQKSGGIGARIDVAISFWEGIKATVDLQGAGNFGLTYRGEVTTVRIRRGTKLRRELPVQQLRR